MPNITADQVDYLHPAADAVTRTVQAKLEETISLADFGFVGDGTTDDTEAWQQAIAAAGETEVRKILVPWGETGVSLVTGQIVDGTMPAGLCFEAQARSGQNDQGSTGIRLKYTGSETCWNIRYPNHTPVIAGEWVWSHLAFEATQATATMFSFNDPLTHSPVDGSGYSYLHRIRFESCYSQGPMAGSSQTGDFIRAAKCFHMVVDETCFIRGWRRGIWLKGCDNCTIAARLYLNVRNVMIEGSGSFGNDNLVTSRWLGLTMAGSEDPYILYDSGVYTVVNGPFLEHDPAVNGSECEALLYLNGFGTRVIAPAMAGAPLFRLGPSARECNLDGPLITTSDQNLEPIVDPPATWDFGYGQEDFRLTIRDASVNFQRTAGDHPRFRYVNRARAYESGLDQGLYMLAGSGGFQPQSHICSGLNYWGRSLGTPANGGIAGIVEDAAATGGWAIELDKDTTQAGFLLRFIIGKDIQPGWFRLRTRTRYSPGDLSSSSWTVHIFKDESYGIGAHATHVLPSSGTSYTLANTIIDATGFADGNILDIVIYRTATPNADLRVDYVELRPVGAAIADPSGGATQDAQSRAAIAAIIDALQERGLIA